MVRYGVTRVVLVVGRLVFKFPRPDRWRTLLNGMLANMDEVYWYRNSPEEWQLKMAPVVFALRGGFLVVARRARILTQEEYALVDPKYFEPLPYDPKPGNMGYYQGRLVLVDYADAPRFPDLRD